MAGTTVAGAADVSAGATDEVGVSAPETLGTTLDAGDTGGGGARSGSGGDGSSEAGTARRSFAGAEGLGALSLAAVVVFGAALGVFEEGGSAIAVTTFARGASTEALSTGLLSPVSPALATATGAGAADATDSLIAAAFTAVSLIRTAGSAIAGSAGGMARGALGAES